jgi:DNA-binding transcriptional ArsR family regulator
MSRTVATADTFQAIADPTRRRLLNRLAEGEQPVSSLAARFDVTLSAISQHLRILREAGLVTEQRVGRQRIYRLNAARLQEVAEWVAHYERFWSEKLDALGDYLERSP